MTTQRQTVHLSPETIAELRKRPHQERLSISIDPALIAFARDAAEEAGVPISRVIAWAIAKHRENARLP